MEWANKILGMDKQFHSTLAMWFLTHARILINPCKLNGPMDFFHW